MRHGIRMLTQQTTLQYRLVMGKLAYLDGIMVILL